MAKEMGVGATQQQMSYYLQIAVSDPDNGRAPIPGGDEEIPEYCEGNRVSGTMRQLRQLGWEWF